jgi:hypothetical protein
MTIAVKEARMVLYIMGILFSFSAAGTPAAVHPIRRQTARILTRCYSERASAADYAS